MLRIFVNNRPLGYERVYLPDHKASGTPLYIQGGDGMWLCEMYLFITLAVPDEGHLWRSIITRSQSVSSSLDHANCKLSMTSCADLQTRYVDQFTG